MTICSLKIHVEDSEKNVVKYVCDEKNYVGSISFAKISTYAWKVTTM